MVVFQNDTCVGCLLPLSAKSYKRDVTQAKVSKSTEMEGYIALLKELLSIYGVN